MVANAETHMLVSDVQEPAKQLFLTRLIMFLETCHAFARPCRHAQAVLRLAAA
jgi:hypothetical protein